MAKVLKKEVSSGNQYNEKYIVITSNKKNKSVSVELNCLMPSAYTASKRLELKEFEKRVMSGIR